MADEKKPETIILRTGSSEWAWALIVFVLIVMTVGAPDLFDVLQEWCRRYLESQ